MILAVTGHRPKTMGLSYSDADRERLESFAAERLSVLSPDTVITGMALGWDQAVAWGCFCLGISFTAAVPFPCQADAWPRKAREHYYFLLGAATNVEFVSETDPRNNLEMNAMLHQRDAWMVDHGERLLALWNGLPSGTGSTVRYAESKGKPVTNVWQAWLDFKA